MTDLVERVVSHLTELLALEDRHVGGPGNRAATAYFARVAGASGWDVRRQWFDCIDWVPGPAKLSAQGRDLELFCGPYSPAYDGRARLVAVSSVEELECSDVRGCVVLLHGDIAAGQLMPRNFVWYNPEEHQRAYRAIDAQSPAALIAATDVDPGLVGAQSPFPLFEDGDLLVPNAYTDVDTGNALLELAGSEVSLRIDSQRIPARAEHVTAWMGEASGPRVVVSAHIDSRRGSPGALDNATGVATLLVLAELLATDPQGVRVELVPFNGEDDYANPGEMLWAAENHGRWDEIALMINIDDAAQKGTVNHVSLYGCDARLEATAAGALEGSASTEMGPQWYQGDHMIAVQNGRPALAIASSDMTGFMARYAHTPGDRIELADPALVVEAARYVAAVVRRMGST